MLKILVPAILFCFGIVQAHYPPVGIEEMYPQSFPEHLLYSIWNDADSGSGTLTLVRADGKLQDAVTVMSDGSKVTFTIQRDSLGRVIRMIQRHGNDSLVTAWKWNHACPTSENITWNLIQWTLDQDGHCKSGVLYTKTGIDTSWFATNASRGEIWNGGLRTLHFGLEEGDTSLTVRSQYDERGREILREKFVFYPNSSMPPELEFRFESTYLGDALVQNTQTWLEYGDTLSRILLRPDPLASGIAIAQDRSPLHFVPKAHALAIRNPGSQPRSVELLQVDGRCLARTIVPARSASEIALPAWSGLLLWRSGTSGGRVYMPLR